VHDLAISHDTAPNITRNIDRDSLSHPHKNRRSKPAQLARPAMHLIHRRQRFRPPCLALTAARAIRSASFDLSALESVHRPSTEVSTNIGRADDSSSCRSSTRRLAETPRQGRHADQHRDKSHNAALTCR
jgi:hypothetical protein